MPGWVIGVIFVISFCLAGEQNMPAMMEVIVPLRRIKAWPAAVILFKPMRLIIIILKDQMDLTARNSGPDPLGKLRENMRLAILRDRVHGIDAQSVKTKLFESVERIMNEG